MRNLISLGVNVNFSMDGCQIDLAGCNCELFYGRMRNLVSLGVIVSYSIVGCET